MKEISVWINHSIWGPIDRKPLIELLASINIPNTIIRPLIVFTGRYEWDKQLSTGQTIFEQCKEVYDLAVTKGLKPIPCMTLFPQQKINYPTDFLTSQAWWDNIAYSPTLFASRLGLKISDVAVDAEPYNDGKVLIKNRVMYPLDWWSSPEADLVANLIASTPKPWAKYFLPGRQVASRYRFYNMLLPRFEIPINEQDYYPERGDLITDNVKEIAGAWIATNDRPFYDTGSNVLRLFTGETFFKERFPLFDRHFIYGDYNSIPTIIQEFVDAAKSEGPMIDIQRLKLMLEQIEIRVATLEQKDKELKAQIDSRLVEYQGIKTFVAAARQLLV